MTVRQLLFSRDLLDLSEYIWFNSKESVSIIVIYGPSDTILILYSITVSKYNVFMWYLDRFRPSPRVTRSTEQIGHGGFAPRRHGFS